MPLFSVVVFVSVPHVVLPLGDISRQHEVQVFSTAPALAWSMCLTNVNVGGATGSGIRRNLWPSFPSGDLIEWIR